MDNIDLKILSCLKENSRMSASEIGDRISMSVSAIIERIKKLEATGVIKQYTLMLDSKSIGKGLTAFISVSLEHPKNNENFEAFVLNHKDIAQCHYITGDFDFILKVVTNSTESLEKILFDIKSIGGVSLTKTLVVLSTVKDEYTVLPEILSKK